MALGADNVQAAGIDDMVMQRLPFTAQRLRALLLVGVRQAGVSVNELDLLFDIATEYDVGSATGHVGRDRDHFRPARLRNDFRFARMLLRIQDVMRELGIGQDA